MDEATATGADDAPRMPGRARGACRPAGAAALGVAAQVLIGIAVVWVGPAWGATFDLRGWRAHVARLEAQAEAEPRNAEVALRLAWGLAARAVPEGARRWALEAGRRGANPLRVHLVLGDAALRVGQEAVAVREYFEVIDRAPHNAYAHLRLWQALRDAEPGELPKSLDRERIRMKLDAAGYHLPAMLARPPRTGEAAGHVRRGFESVRAGRFHEAVDRFHAALHDDVNQAEAYRGLGVAWAAQNQPEKALGAYHLYLLLTPRKTRESRRIQRLVDEAARRRGLAVEAARLRRR